MTFWKEISQLINEGHEAIMLYVFDNEGSSPGKQGFKMAVLDNDVLLGSIGGGMMEHKLVELAKTHLSERIADFVPYLKQQIHRSDAERNQSGMICSGQQTVGFYYLSSEDRDVLEDIATASSGLLQLSESGLAFLPDQLLDHPGFDQQNDLSWVYQEDLRKKHVAHIVGAGHVGLALSRILHQLGFYIHLYDDREDLYMFKINDYADEKHLTSYNDIARFIKPNQNNYVVIVSFGFRTDKLVLEKLIQNKYRFLGMMGSEAKVSQILSELKDQGISKQDLDRLHAPIGILKHSITPEEIAVSIAAQLIEVKNDTSFRTS